MRKNGFTLIEVIVSVVLVSVVMVSLLGSLIQIRQTYTLIHENSDVLVYSSSISRVINNDLMSNNGIRYSTCNTEGTKCSIILGNDSRRELELFTDEVDLGTDKNINHDNIKTTLRYSDTTKYENNNRTNEDDKEIVYIRTLELDKYTNEETGQITASGYNFYDMNTTQYEHSSDEVGNNMIDVFTTIKIRLYDGISYDNSRYDVVLYASGRYDYSSLVGKAYRIKLDNDGATTAGTTSIDEVFGVGYYESESVHNNSNLIKKITIPTKDGGSSNMAFLGYYYVPAGVSVETQIIDASGAIIASSRLFKNNVDLVEAASGLARVYAKWGDCSEGFEIQNGACVQKQYTVTLNKNGGTGGESSYQVKYQNRVKDLIGVPKKTGYRFVGYNSAIDNTGFHDDKGKGLVLYTYSTNTTLNAQYAECSSGTYSNLDNNTCDVCVAGSITSSTGQGSCVACQNGTSTDGTDRTSCSGNCSNKAHAATWKTAIWNTNNTLTDACQILTCATGYRLNSNACTAITYQVAYNKNGGSGTDMSKSTHTYDVNKNLSQNTYTRTGYSFTGWAETATGAKKYDDKQSVKNLTTTHNATVTIYAVWEGNTYTATYNNNGGSGCDTKSVTYGSAYGTLCTPTKTGYTFGGWYKESSLTTQVTASTTVNTASNHNLYAKWTANTYTVTYNNNSGSGCDTKSVTYDSTYGTLCSPTRSGYDFAGWYKESGLTNQVTASTTVNTASAHTLYAKWTAHKVYVRYNANGGSWAGSTASDLDLDGSFVASNGNSTTAFNVNYNGTLNLANYNYSGYINISKTGYAAPSGSQWCTAANGTGTCYDQTVDYTNVGTDATASTHFCDARSASCTVTLYVNWVPNTYTVTYNNNSGSGCTTKSVTYNSTYGTLCTPTRSGYTFAGWYKESGLTNQVTASTTVNTASNHNLYAKWTANTYTVTYNNNSGSGCTNKTVTFASTYGTLCSPTRTGYTFAGWYKETGLTNQVTASTTVNTASNHGLYAKWTGNSYTVTYNNNSGSGCTNKTVTYCSTYGTLCTPTRTGYTFAGWYKESALTNQITASSTVNTASAHGLYAKWTANTYTVTYNNNGGSGCTNKTVTYASTYGTLCTPTRSGYDFAGWYKESGLTNQVTASTTVNTASAHTLYAKWTAHKIYLRYHVNGGTWAGSTNTHLGVSSSYVTYDGNSTTVFNVNYGDTINLADYNNASYINISKTGYSGKSGAQWCTASNGGGTCYNMSTDYTNAGTDATASTHFCDARSASCTVTLYVNWVPNTYTVTYENNGGSGCSTKSVTYNSTYGTLCTPSKTGYTFKGWYKDSSFNTQVTASSTVSTAGNHPLYAKWDGNSYTVTLAGYYMEDTALEGRVLNLVAADNPAVWETGAFNLTKNQNYVMSFDYRAGSNHSSNQLHIDLYPDTLPEGPTLTASTTNKHYDWVTTSSHNDMANAKFRWYSYVTDSYITIDQVMISRPSSITVKYGNTYSNLPTPTRSGYTFGGWYDSNNNAVGTNTTVSTASNHILHAKWSRNGWTRKTWTCTKGAYTSDIHFYSKTCTGITQGDADANNYNYWRTCSYRNAASCTDQFGVDECYYVEQYRRTDCVTWAEPPTVETGLATCEASNDYRIYVGCY